MPAKQQWFITRQKRQLTDILPALICFNDICEGKVWSGNKALQLRLEDALSEKEITRHGSLRARREGQGGGGTRTLFTQLKDLGLVFIEEDTGKLRLTLVAEAMIKAELTFVEAMRLQLKRYQYPSATRWAGRGQIDHRFKVHPFIFMFRLLRDERLQGYITMNEMSLIVIHDADSDSNRCFERVVAEILEYRQTGRNGNGIQDTASGAYHDIANTFFNYLELTQYIDRGYGRILVRAGKEDAIDRFVTDIPAFIEHPEIQENYQRKYGVGTVMRDLRDFSDDRAISRVEMNEARIKSEYALLKLRMPITTIDREIVDRISERTGIDSRIVESFLIRTFPHGSTDDFFSTYREYAYGGRQYATDFELATVEIFRRIFGMTATHVGPIGNTPDVFVESDVEEFSGIIDNKAYEKGYSISGDHKRRMIDEYIPKVQDYAEARYPLAFFSYISTDFGTHINEQLQEITRDTGVNGSAMPVDLMIDFAQDYAEKGYTHSNVRDVFSVNRRISVDDV